MEIENLYNKMLFKSRNLKIYKKYGVKDSLSNKIFLLLIHFSFIFNKIKNNDLEYNQKIFDYLFLRIETDLREVGFGDMSINKNMKTLVNKFYFILKKFNNFQNCSKKKKINLFTNLLNFVNNDDKKLNNIIEYFNKFSKKIDLISANDIYVAKF